MRLRVTRKGRVKRGGRRCTVRPPRLLPLVYGQTGPFARKNAAIAEPTIKHAMYRRDLIAACLSTS